MVGLKHRVEQILNMATTLSKMVEALCCDLSEKKREIEFMYYFDLAAIGHFGF